MTQLVTSPAHATPQISQPGMLDYDSDDGTDLKPIGKQRRQALSARTHETCMHDSAHSQSPNPQVGEVNGDPVAVEQTCSPGGCTRRPLLLLLLLLQLGWVVQCPALHWLCWR